MDWKPVHEAEAEKVGGSCKGLKGTGQHEVEKLLCLQEQGGAYMHVISQMQQLEPASNKVEDWFNFPKVLK